MLRKAAGVSTVCVIIACCLGCGSTVSHFVFAALPAANQIAVYREDPNSGILTAIANSPFATGTGPQSIAVHPSRKYLYVANSGDTTPDVSLFTISSVGALTEVTPRTAVNGAPFYLAMDPGGSFLYVASPISNSVSVFSINSGSGALTAVSGSPFPLGVTPVSMQLSPSGKFLYVGVSGSPGAVEAFNLKGGVLSIAGTTATGANPYGLAIDPAGKYLYTANSLDNSISEFTIASNGTLTQLSGSPIGQSFNAPVALLVDASGKHLYVANEGSNNIAVYSIGTGGALTVLATPTFGTETTPSFLAADPNGKFLMVGSQGSSAGIQVFGFISDGTLTSSIATYSQGNTISSLSVIQ